MQHGSNRTPDSAVTALQTVTVIHFRAPARLPATAVITVAGARKWMTVTVWSAVTAESGVRFEPCCKRPP
ncbi:hypothetical protein, partial [Streptomyces sp. ME109]|uniref:hypothetical protein n=1 Tax=Streptomyces sp. me109 TaxID=1827853 RepID=UPI001C9D16A1